MFAGGVQSNLVKLVRKPKSLAETAQILRVMPLSTHKKEDFLMFCEETNTSNNDMVVLQPLRICAL